MTKYLTRGWCANDLGVSEDAFDRVLASRQIEYIRIGRAVRILAESYRAWKEANSIKPIRPLPPDPAPRRPPLSRPRRLLQPEG